MTKEKSKTVPFNLNLARRVKSGYVKGGFFKRNGKNVSWLSDNILTPQTWNKMYGNQLFADTCSGGYVSYFQTDEHGLFDDENGENENDVLIKVWGSSEHTFVPTKFQSCVVRNDNDSVWRIAVHTGNQMFTGANAFYSDVDEEKETFCQCVFLRCLPLNKETVKLVGTKNQYKENEKD